MTDEPFIDTHIHFWDRSRTDLEWSWLKPGFSFRHWESSPSLDVPRFSTPELLDESEGSGLAAIVHGHSADPIDDPAVETGWLESVAERHRMPDAIVGKCSLAASEAVDVMHRHATYPRFRGVRDPAALQRLDVEEIATAMDAAGDLGISVEVRREHHQFAVLHELADRWPSVTIALSHACLPLVRSREQLAEWDGAMRELAAHPNIVCKISAVAGASDPDWTVDSIRPWILACVDVFGADRCMLGSNWPVDRLFGTYRQLVEAYRSVTAELDPAERAAVFHGTAERVYRITLG
jgi:predicted TIM-barrel fold metal-dependent hydrolase